MIQIDMDLSPASIDSAIEQLKQYKRDLEMGAEMLQRRMAAGIAREAQTTFDASVSDDLLLGPEYGGVTVKDTHSRAESIVTATGKQVAFMEFGAGVFHNGSVGSSPHPLGAQLGMTIGSYGDGNGKKSVWGFRDGNNKLVLTHGVPASMPLYNAYRANKDRLVDMAKGVMSDVDFMRE